MNSLRTTAARTVRIPRAPFAPATRCLHITSPLRSGTDKTHANADPNSSFVPKKVQEKLPEEVENAVPNTVHDTSDNKSKSHATGPSVVPESIQEAAPESVERALPESIHPTEGKQGR
ncbi:uncharacterized protein AB675_5154 [Cyphellophora attinorum]|uniref:Uncharacterized protein n=1 Tax=Cyphellophora attinorum TaxID=1664694 RepID=A0A0N1HSS1_9EURO|nr:uncharacterized protein AB675_5154 [Phialophora attinorum]KPI39345.1 hypothetical protein AB675_5154 [Phialophora attinorum]